MRFQPEPLQSFAGDLLRALGTPAETSSTVAASLVHADLRGSGTHGVGILPLYAEMITANAINPSAKPTIKHLTDSLSSVDGQSAFGQLAGAKATATGIKAAGKHGVAVVGIRNGSHLGRLGEWAELATSEGMVFMAFSNTGGGAKNVAPFGGHKRKLSTNPVAFGIPTFDVLPFDIIVDFATSQVSGSVIREHYFNDIPLNGEWTTTASGKPLSDARSFMEGEGALLPLGGRVTGHKGYGLAVIAELLGGFVGGAVVGQQDPEWFSNAAMFILIDPTSFLTVNEIEDRVAAIAEHLRDDSVRLPGEGSHQCEITARKQGIEIPDHVKGSLVKMAIDLHVEVPNNFADTVSTSNDGNKSLKTW